MQPSQLFMYIASIDMAFIDYCVTILGIECPACEKMIWVDEGNTQDMTVGDHEGAICGHCGNKFLFDDDFIAEDDDRTIDDCDLAMGYKTPNEAARIK